MKKTVYYVTPFVIVPVLMLLLEFLDDNLLRMSPYVLGGLLFLASAVIGNLTPTHKSFDCIMTAIMPLSLFCLMFVVGLVDGDPGPAFDLQKAFEVAFAPMALVLYFIMAITTFFASFRGHRITKKAKV